MNSQENNNPRSPAGGNGGEPTGYETLEAWGWDERWQESADSFGASAAGALRPARVVRHVHHHYDLITLPGARSLRAEVAGAFAFRAAIGLWWSMKRPAFNKCCPGAPRLAEAAPGRRLLSRSSPQM